MAHELTALEIAVLRTGIDYLRDEFITHGKEADAKQGRGWALSALAAAEAQDWRWCRHCLKRAKSFLSPGRHPFTFTLATFRHREDNSRSFWSRDVLVTCVADGKVDWLVASYKNWDSLSD